jgi:hypothetical protein
MEYCKNVIICLLLLYAPLCCRAQFNPVDVKQQYPPEVQVINCLEETLLNELGNVETDWNTGEDIDKYFDEFGLKPGLAWCSIFVMWVYKSCDVENNGTPWSPSWFIKPYTFYHKDQLCLNMITPKFGDVFGIYFRNLGRVAHVGFIYRWIPNSKWCLTIEGNVIGSRGIEGVHMVMRLKSEVYIAARYIQ